MSADRLCAAAARVPSVVMHALAGLLRLPPLAAGRPARRARVCALALPCPTPMRLSP